MSEKLPALAYDEATLSAFLPALGRELGVFGSAARNELQADSDVDVMVPFSQDSRTNLLDFVAMQDELAAIFGRRVDLMERGPVHNPFRRRTIERDLTVIYAA